MSKRKNVNFVLQEGIRELQCSTCILQIPINGPAVSLPNHIVGKVLRVPNYTVYQEDVVASTKETTLIGHISDVVRPERGTDFIA